MWRKHEQFRIRGLRVSLQARVTRVLKVAPLGSVHLAAAVGSEFRVPCGQGLHYFSISENGERFAVLFTSTFMPHLRVCLWCERISVCPVHSRSVPYAPPPPNRNLQTGLESLVSPPLSYLSVETKTAVPAADVWSAMCRWLARSCLYRWWGGGGGGGVRLKPPQADKSTVPATQARVDTKSLLRHGFLHLLVTPLLAGALFWLVQIQPTRCFVMTPSNFT